MRFLRSQTLVALGCLSLSACGGQPSADSSEVSGAEQVALVVALDVALDSWWEGSTGRLGLDAFFEFESSVLSSGPDCEWLWPAWAPSAAVAAWLSCAPPEALGRTDSADAGSLIPRLTHPTIAEDFARAGWRTWRAAGKDDLALGSSEWFGFDSVGLATQAEGPNGWLEELEAWANADSAPLFAFGALSASDLQLLDSDRAGSWRAWSKRRAQSGNNGIKSIFSDADTAALAGGASEAWIAVGERVGRRRGAPEAQAFEALQQGARLLAADRVLAAFERTGVGSRSNLLVALVGAVQEHTGAPWTPVWGRGVGDLDLPLGGSMPPAAWRAGLGEFALALGVVPSEAGLVDEFLLWGSDPNRPYRWEAGQQVLMPEAFDLQDPTDWRVNSGWRLVFPQNQPSLETHVEVRFGEQDSLQGWIAVGRDGVVSAHRAGRRDRFEVHFEAGSAPDQLLWLTARRGAPQRLTVEVGDEPLEGERLFFKGKPVGRGSLPQLLEPGELASDEVVAAWAGPVIERGRDGHRVRLPKGTELIGGRSWPPGPVSWAPCEAEPDRKDGPEDASAVALGAEHCLDWRAPGRLALVLQSAGRYFRPSDFLFDRRLDRGRDAAWVLWPVHGPARTARRPWDKPESVHTDRDGDLLPSPTTPANDALAEPSHWRLEPLGAPFADDPELWTRPVPDELWTAWQGIRRRAPGR